MKSLAAKVVFIFLCVYFFLRVIFYGKRNDERAPKDQYLERLDEFLIDELEYGEFRANLTRQHLGEPIRKKNDKERTSFIDAAQNQQGYINVYYYADICNDYDNYATLWNTLFPKFPAKAVTFENFYDEKLLTEAGQSRRMIGLIQPDTTDWYQFQINSRMGCEVRIIEKIAMKDEVYDNFLLHFGLYKEQIVKEDTSDEPEKAFIVESQPVRLLKGEIYLLDVIHVIPIYGFLHLKWKKKIEKKFEKIPSELLSTLYSKPLVTDILPNITYRKTVTENTKLLLDDRRNNFHELPSLNIDIQRQCDYTPSYIPDYIPPDQGVAFVKVDRVYPKNRLIEHHHQAGYYDLYIEKETVFKVVKKYMKLLGSQYTIRHIVNLEENKEGKNGKRYFVEVDVIKDGTSQVYRSSGWIFIENESSEICVPTGYTWNKKENIYLITPVKNQARWIRYLIHSLNEIVEKTKESNIHLILVDFDSTDVDLQKVLEQSKFQYTYQKLHGKFNKVIGLNRAVSAIEEEDPIVFILDLQLQLPVFLFDYIRKHTFRGRTTYVPILLRLACGEHSQYTKPSSASIWQEIGYGMISIFKTDWLKIGGMNETRFSQKWGGEDWELVERILKNKIEVIHHRLPGYYHIHHSTKGTWDGTKEF